MNIRISVRTGRKKIGLYSEIKTTRFKNVWDAELRKYKGTDLFLNRAAPAASLHPTTTFSCKLVDKPVTAGKTYEKV